jgi:hypothetical protein
MTDISNNQDVKQNFAYITQVKNDDGVVILLSWLTGYYPLDKYFLQHNPEFQLNLEFFIFRYLFEGDLIILMLCIYHYL